MAQLRSYNCDVQLESNVIVNLDRKHKSVSPFFIEHLLDNVIDPSFAAASRNR